MRVRPVLDFTLKSLIHKIFSFSGQPGQKYNTSLLESLKKVNDSHKQIKCPDIRDKLFEVIHITVSLDKIYI